MVSLVQLATEALGIPENILEVNEEIYNKILKFLSMRKAISFSDADSLNTSIKGPFKIGDTVLDKVNVTIETQPTQRNEITTVGAAYGLKSALDGKVFKYEQSPIAEIRISIGIPQTRYSLGGKWSEVYDHLTGQGKIVTLSSLAHELKHAYDNAKMGNLGEPVPGRIKYQRSTEMVGLLPLDKFNYFIYYTYFIENLVRPVEVAAELKYNKVTKGEFVQALQNTDVYKKLKTAQALSYNGMVQDIINDPNSMGFVSRSLLHANPKLDLDEYSDEEVVASFLQLVYQDKMENSLQGYASMAASSMGEFFKLMNEDFQGIQQDKVETYKEVVKEINRFEDHRDYYINEEKKIKIIVDKVIRRLAKLYAYID